MTKTGYTITHDGVIFTAHRDGNVVTRCFDHVENALHSIFITEESREGDYYILQGEDVYLKKETDVQ